MGLISSLLPIGNNWDDLLNEEFNSVYFKELINFLDSEYEHKKIAPPVHKIFEAFRVTAPEKLKIVLIGQDPYHGLGQANGLSFSVNHQVKLPPSLKNIFKELERDLAIKNTNGDLSSWARQGVLLLNTCLTVRLNEPASHKDKGWERFSDAVIKIIAERNNNLIFLLWGNFAKEKGALIDEKKHSILYAAHPSPFSAHRGFLGCSHFSTSNQILAQHNKEPIDWLIPNTDTLFSE